MFRLFQIGNKILLALSFNQLYISLKFHLFTLMFFAKHSIIKRLESVEYSGKLNGLRITDWLTITINFNQEIYRSNK